MIQLRYLSPELLVIAGGSLIAFAVIVTLVFLLFVLGGLLPLFRFVWSIAWEVGLVAAMLLGLFVVSNVLAHP